MPDLDFHMGGEVKFPCGWERVDFLVGVDGRFSCGRGGRLRFPCGWGRIDFCWEVEVDFHLEGQGSIKDYHINVSNGEVY